MRRTPREEDFHGAAHHPTVTSRVGLWLGASFGVCFVTGLISHAIAHPPGWFEWPSRPVSLYRITQGLHVISGVAAIPLLLAKLWSVYPKLFARPLVRSLPHAIERASILVLSGAAFFELATGILNVAQNYPWRFFFPAAHYAVAWIAVGSVLVHVAVKLPVIRRSLSSAVSGEPSPEPDPPGTGMTRRGFLRTTTLATGTAVVATAGATVTPLRDLSVLSWRSDRGPQGLPVNRTAAAAGVIAAIRDPHWTLEVVSGRGMRLLSLAELAELPQTTAELPIACVEGWSQSATWSGVAVPDLLRAVGAAPGAVVHVRSLERGSPYASTTLPRPFTSDQSTLLALRLNGEPLDVDHGYPCRLIAPNRPGVLQTKWIATLEIL